MAGTTKMHGGAPAAIRAGADGNERLTALAGAALLVLLAVEGLTIVFLRPLLPVHFFVGMLLIGPVLLKLGSTGYRFARYYLGAPEYRRKGPPAPLLRLIGPFVILTSLAVLGTGVALAFTKPQHGLLLTAHKASFVLWFGFMTIHVLAYVWRVPGSVAAEVRAARGRRYAGRRARRGPALPGRHGASTEYGLVAGGRRRAAPLAGRATRWLVLALALAAGLVIAAATVHLAGPWATLVGGQ